MYYIFLRDLFSMIPGVGNVIGYHHGKFKSQCIFEGTDIQPESFLKLFKTVHQCISVYIKLSGCFGKIQVVFKESSDNIQSFIINRIQKISPTNMSHT